MDLKPITVPANWNAERDLAYFDTEGWPPVPSYRAALSNWLSFYYGEFTGAVALSVTCFMMRNPGLLSFELDCLPTGEQIALLLRWMQGPTYTGKYRAEIIGCLRACAFIEAERARLLTDYQQAGERAWLCPLVQLCHWLNGCAAALEEAMSQEDLGYGEIKRRVKEAFEAEKG